VRRIGEFASVLKTEAGLTDPLPPRAWSLPVDSRELRYQLGVRGETRRFCAPLCFLAAIRSRLAIEPNERHE
jgi:hypothetical protein